jgi:hypothetical protein
VLDFLEKLAVRGEVCFSTYVWRVIAPIPLTPARLTALIQEAREAALGRGGTSLLEWAILKGGPESIGAVLVADGIAKRDKLDLKEKCYIPWVLDPNLSSEQGVYHLFHLAGVSGNLSTIVQLFALYRLPLNRFDCWHSVCQGAMESPDPVQVLEFALLHGGSRALPSHMLFKGTGSRAKHVLEWFSDYSRRNRGLKSVFEI